MVKMTTTQVCDAPGADHHFGSLMPGWQACFHSVRLLVEDFIECSDKVYSAGSVPALYCNFFISV